MNKLAIIEHLEGLADGSIDPINDRLGICNELDNKFSIDGYKLVERFSVLWHKFSGDGAFPVPHPDGCSMLNYLLRPAMWTGQYGANRRELCSFVAKRMREELE